MKLIWQGHACYTLESADGTVVFDPYEPGYVPGLTLPELSADVVLCSPAFFATMLEKAGAKYTPTTNEKLLAAAAGGQVGNYLGMTWIEVNGFAHSKPISYYDFSSTKKTVTAADLKLVDFIMYDHNAFGAGDNFTMARLRDSERFAGVLAQTEDNVAFKVLEPTVVRVRKHAGT